ncbi:MAG: FAD-dependent oxidoreductase [Clostridia bacterium]|nr:FAD-dependent oxidoreductase [Clostridia bacterium]
MKKLLAMLLSVCMLLSMVTFAAVAEGKYTPGEYEGTAQGFGGTVTVKVTVDENAVTAVTVTGENETAALGGAAIEGYNTSLVGVTDADAVEVTSGATVTSTAVKDALAQALAAAAGEEQTTGEIKFVPGEYEGTAEGYNGDVTLKVTFGETTIENIEVVSSKETEHVGDVAFEPMFENIKAFTSTSVDVVSGATFTSRAVLNAVNDAAEKAGCDKAALTKGAVPFAYEAKDAIEETYDVVVVGAGGAGMAAAAQAAQDGNTVLVIEKNAEVGGNTLVSGGQYQSVMPYLVWDASDPDATTGVGYDGKTYNKVVESIATVDELKTILNWSEEPFDEDYYKDHEFVAGDIEELSKHGVHAEYLPTLQALKAEIQAYLDWAQPKIDAGAGELTLFSTVNLHIFQTYYGGLRPSADMSSWIYGDFDLVNQFIQGGQELKQWLEAQGSTFVEDTQPTLIGALWYRENEFVGATIDGVDYAGRWGTYFKAPMNTLLNTAETAASNKIMLRTTANELIYEDGKVTGVKATQYDGTEVTAHATKGVILATGGYAANLEMVVDTNVYWSSEYVSTSTKTTNRSSLQGDGITMAQAVGADVTGMGFTQMMPISWVDNGNLAFGGGNYAIYINPTTGKRFVDETSERDVLSLAEFRNGIEHNGTKGVFIEIANASSKIPGPYLYGDEDVEWRQYVRTVDELADLFTSLGLPTDAETVRATIESYDKAVMAGEQPEDVKKTNPNALIGSAEKDENGKYLPDTYTLDGVELRIRLLAPSTHHTMGGVKVDTERHVLDTNGAIISGLYAAGEVTGGIHGGNRLGGNAIVEIYVSGRTAAQAVTADNK